MRILCEKWEKMKNMRMDEFDRKILAALQQDARLTNADLAERVGLSSSQCSRRRSHLEDSGIILGYHAQLDQKRAGVGLVSLISISLTKHDEQNANHLRKMLQRLDNVQSAYALTGEMDYMIVVSSSNLDDLSTFINQTLLPHPAVQNVKTSIALETLKQTTSVPL